MNFERTEGEFTVSTDSKRVDLSLVHEFLTNCYWARGIPLDVVRRSIENSLCFGVYSRSKQVGFARVITDSATFAYLADVFILPKYRGHGLSKLLMRCIMEHPELQGLRRWSLATADAHGLYSQFGFKQVTKPEMWMEIHRPDVYSSAQKMSR
ncbi:MAG: GNAT family N-acetyltransferase [Acidobacteriales bacterium]|nr:GNAT family N-acetyltransferase [Terriglobales bacterium]